MNTERRWDLGSLLSIMEQSVSLPEETERLQLSVVIDEQENGNQCVTGRDAPASNLVALDEHPGFLKARRRADSEPPPNSTERLIPGTTPQPAELEEDAISNSSR